MYGTYQSDGLLCNSQDGEGLGTDAGFEAWDTERVKATDDIYGNFLVPPINGNAFYGVFKEGLGIAIPVEQPCGDILYDCVGGVLSKLLVIMEIVNNKLQYTWCYRGNNCTVVLDQSGKWTMYVISSKLVCAGDVYDTPFNSMMELGRGLYMYRLYNDPDTDITLSDPMRGSTVASTTFKSLSYIERYVNMFVAHLMM